MSIKYMSKVFEMPLKTHEKMLLLAISDCANDDGLAYPGYEKLMKKTSMARATLSKNIKILSAAGLFEKKSHSSIGKGKSVNTYQLTFDNLDALEERLVEARKVHAAKSSSGELGISRKVQTTKSSSGELRKVQRVNSISSTGEHETSVLNVSKEPSVYIRAPKTDNPKSAQKKKTSFDPLAELILLNVSEQVASDFLVHRKEKRAKVTKTVLNGFVREAGKAGITLEQALVITCERNWIGFNASWDWQPDKPEQPSNISTDFGESYESEGWGIKS